MYKIMWSYIIIGILTGLAANEVLSVARQEGFKSKDAGPPTFLEDDTNTSLLVVTTDRMDTADVMIISNIDFRVTLLVQSDSCYKCSMIERTEIRQFSNHSVLFDTNYGQRLELVDVDLRPVCSMWYRFVEYGLYTLHISHSSGEVDERVECTISLLNTPRDLNIPVYVALAVMVGCFIIWRILREVYRRGVLHRFAFCWPQELQINADLGWCPIMGEQDPTTSLPRIKSVDTFRGLSLAVMIFVNYGGGNYYYFMHSIWDGLTIADLVFPWFVFLMGTSVAMSCKSSLRRGTSRITLVLHAVKRTAILFFLGLMISNSGGDVMLSHVRILGVLQRLALTYLVVALTEIVTSKSVDHLITTRLSFVRDLIPFWPVWIVTGSLLTIYLCLTFLLPVPGCPTGYLGPGGLHENGSYENCTGGSASYIDRQVLGPDHMYKFGRFKAVYNTTVSHDPEGILGTLSSILLCILGLQAGKILTIYQSWFKLCRRWIIWAVILGLIAGVLCDFRQFGGWIPLNKNLWSLSFVLAMASMAFFILAALYVVIDVHNWWDGAPFCYPGMNSILIYMCHEVFEKCFPVQFTVAQDHLSHLLMNIWGTAFWIIISAVLYFKKTFISI